jgi:CDP-diacylglycerol--glycerol-3-phosphate 3-phosphatidyltransferase
MGPADQLTVARMAAAPVIVALFAIDFDGHEYWATALFAIAMATDWVDGWLARRSDSSSAMGSLLDPVADKILVLSVLIVLLGEGIFAGWVVAAMLRASSSSRGPGWPHSSAASFSAHGISGS